MLDINKRILLRECGVIKRSAGEAIEFLSGYLLILEIS